MRGVQIVSAVSSRRRVWPVVVVATLVMGACVLAALQAGGGVRSGVVLLAGVVATGIAAVLTYAVASPLPGAVGGAGRSAGHFIGPFGGGGGDFGSGGGGGGDCG
jgi:uncharacterized membrane protein YgcG